MSINTDSHQVTVLVTYQTFQDLTNADLIRLKTTFELALTQLKGQVVLSDVVANIYFALMRYIVRPLTALV